jgi:hypothetical protein
MVGGARKAWNGSTMERSSDPSCQGVTFYAPGPCWDDEWSSRGWWRTVVAFSTGMWAFTSNRVISDVAPGCQ